MLGLRPRPRKRAYSAPPDPLAGFKGPTSKGRGGKGRGREGRGGDRRGRNGKGTHSGLDPVPLLFCGSNPIKTGELSQWPSHVDSTVNIFLIIIIV